MHRQLSVTQVVEFIELLEILFLSPHTNHKLVDAKSVHGLKHGRVGGSSTLHGTPGGRRLIDFRTPSTPEGIETCQVTA
jgi:hypothetical protein